jgi:uncharacterized membrane protein YccC
MSGLVYRLLQRLPANVINGISVALGVALVQSSLLPLVSKAALTAVTSGAIYASLPHSVDRAERVVRRTLTGGVVGALTGLLIRSVSGVPIALDLVIGLIVFAAMMSLAWGQRAGAISFTAVLAIVLSLASASTLPVWQVALWSLLGSALYSVWALINSRVLEHRYRTLAVAATFQTSAQLLRSRAELLDQIDASAHDTTARWNQIDDEARLAALIQAARELVFAGPERSRGVPFTQLLFRAIELRDLVLTSRLDLDLLGDNKLAREIRWRLAKSLRTNATALDHAYAALKLSDTRQLPALRDQAHVTALLDDRHLPTNDPRLRLLPALASRQQQLFDLIVSVHDLIRGRRTQVPLSAQDRHQLSARERWPLREVTLQLKLQSPVLRHALRSALALMTVHTLAAALPWATHPHWIVLSVAVVLRGNFSQTLARRNQRVLGTALGCLVAAGTVSIVPEYALSLLFLVAVGVAHAYVNIRYTLTAAAATLMTLLQARLMTVVTPIVVIERLADTVLGASFAWAFSFVLPSWSHRALPTQLERTLSALREYASSTLSTNALLAEQQRLTREQAYEALETLSSTVRLSSAEPRQVRPPIQLLLSFIDHAQGLMAHLSTLRLLLLRRAEQLQGVDTETALSEARERLCKRLILADMPALSQPPLQQEPPSVPAARAAFPWLVRRINISVHEASQTGSAARAALTELQTKARQSDGLGAVWR